MYYIQIFNILKLKTHNIEALLTTTTITTTKSTTTTSTTTTTSKSTTTTTAIITTTTSTPTTSTTLSTSKTSTSLEATTLTGKILFLFKYLSLNNLFNQSESLRWSEQICRALVFDISQLRRSQFGM